MAHKLVSFKCSTLGSNDDGVLLLTEGKRHFFDAMNAYRDARVVYCHLWYNGSRRDFQMKKIYPFLIVLAVIIFSSMVGSNNPLLQQAEEDPRIKTAYRDQAHG